MRENKYLKQAREELAYLSNDPDFQFMVESRAGMLIDIECMKATSQKYGYDEGKSEGILEIAKKMKSKNMNIEDIIELTCLTKEEIEKL